ncbi:MAG: dienelactone hydrolase family protein [Clostridia bacterium]|nr:dienelactone hydrolase family protein [Clostridia bacterium]
MIKYEKTQSVLQGTTPLGYILTMPDDIKEGERLPLIIFLHGAGERGDDINKVKIYCVPKLFTQNSTHNGIRAYTLSPQCPYNTTWCDYKKELIALIDETIEKYNIDKTNVSLTGISMGGFGTWEMAMTYPDRFSKIAPLCGGGMNWRAWALTMPIRVYHGKRDSTVPISQSEAMVNSVRACGGNVEFTAYDDLDHNCWDRAYEKTDLISWLVSNEK